jgi:aspartate/methionine/tyrosine aminotransferase
MLAVVKAPPRPFEYMAWAQRVPSGARWNLSASGMEDTTAQLGDDSPWSGGLTIAAEARRDQRDLALDELGRRLASRYGVAREQVVPTLGASQAITHALLTVVRPGDHVIVERPTYEALHRVPELLGASVSRLERTYDDGWAVSPERLAKLLTPRTRAVVLSNLHNPSGVGIPAKVLAEVCGLAARVGALVLVDEVYLDFCFDLSDPGDWRPAALVADNAVSWSSATKCFGFSAIRCGWLVTRQPEVARALRTTADYLHVYPPVTSARIGALVLRQAEPLTARANRIAAEGREVVDGWLRSERRVAWVPPTAGITGALRLPDLLDDVAFADHLRQAYDTQVVPGSLFECPGFVRLSYGLAPAPLREALDHMSSALDDMRSR